MILMFLKIYISKEKIDFAEGNAFCTSGFLKIVKTSFHIHNMTLVGPLIQEVD